MSGNNRGRQSQQSGNNREQGPRSPVAGVRTKKTFFFNFTNKEGINYSGSFTVRRPTVFDQSRIEAERATLLGGHYYDPDNPGSGVREHADVVADAIAFLRVVVEECPDWWRDGDVYDYDVLGALYHEAEDIDPFRQEMRRSKDKPGVGDVAGGDRGRGAGGGLDADVGDILAKMVDEEVQADDQ